MNICVAQIKPEKGDIEKNIRIHQEWIRIAVVKKVDFIFFPELSLTGFEPTLAKNLAIYKEDPRLSIFQNLSDTNNIIIGIGIPSISEGGVCISMLLFCPNKDRLLYSKQLLHTDEYPYFVEGKKQLIINTHRIKVAPAICFESMKEIHLSKAIKLGAKIYIASVAKSREGVERAYEHYAKMSRKYKIPILMCNSIGPCDSFLSVGKSAIWNPKGKLLASLAEDREDLLIYNTDCEDLI